MNSWVKTSPILIVALSGRTLAHSAARAQYEVVVVDAFNDADLSSAATACAQVPMGPAGGMDGDAILEAAGRMAPPHAGLVYGSGFEGRPGLLRRLAEGRPLFGNSPEVVGRVKRPDAFFPLLRDLNIPHPETRWRELGDVRGWLKKKVGGAGGVHIRQVGRQVGHDAGADRTADAPCYYQRPMEGRSISACFLADGRHAWVLGFSEQWPADGSASRPYRFGGAVAPAAIGCETGATLTRVVESLVQATGLVGLNSADFVVGDRDFGLLEVNPRPGATLDLFERLSGTSLFDLHVRSCAGDSIRSLKGRAEREPTITNIGIHHASGILYADRPFEVTDEMHWPAWVSDRPRAGTHMDPEAPVCTVFASGLSPQDARCRVLQRTVKLRAGLIQREYA